MDDPTSLASCSSPRSYGTWHSLSGFLRDYVVGAASGLLPRRQAADAEAPMQRPIKHSAREGTGGRRLPSHPKDFVMLREFVKNLYKRLASKMWRRTGLSR